MNRSQISKSAVRRGRLRWRIVPVCLLLGSGMAMACSVPVFRYALEHWTSDPYEAVVLHHGPLSDSSQELVRRLQGAAGADAARANLSVQVTDPATADPAVLDVWKKAGSPGSPLLVISPPRSQPPAAPLFSAPLSAETVDAVLDSPARREIARRLGEGESAVWVLLESGDKLQDDAAMRLLEGRLAYLATVLELPKLDAQDIRNGLVSVPDEGLKLAFSTLRIRRGDPAERAFVPMLLATEADLAQEREPMVFPVFGQARVLYALVGAGIRSETIDRAASFLIGSCSCQVKEQNPGADLLVAVNWKKLLKEQSLGVPDLPKVGDIVGTMPEAVTIAPRAGAAVGNKGDSHGLMSRVEPYRAAAIAAVVVVLGLAAWMLLRKTRSRGGSS